MTLIIVILGGAIGAVLRHLCQKFYNKILSLEKRTYQYSFFKIFDPVLLFINVLGSFILGFVTGNMGGASTSYGLFFGSVCGGFTTFSGAMQNLSTPFFEYLAKNRPDEFSKDYIDTNQRGKRGLSFISLGNIYAIIMLISAIIAYEIGKSVPFTL